MGTTFIFVLSLSLIPPFCDEGKNCLDWNDLQTNYSRAMGGIILAIGFQIAIVDTFRSFQKPIRHAFGYVTMLVSLCSCFSWLCSTFMGLLIKTIGRTHSDLVQVLIVWSLFLTVAYLLARTVATRAVPYEKIPIVLFPFQFVGDFFAEMVLVDFTLSSWECKCVFSLWNGTN